MMKESETQEITCFDGKYYILEKSRVIELWEPVASLDGNLLGLFGLLSRVVVNLIVNTILLYAFEYKIIIEYSYEFVMYWYYIFVFIIFINVL